MLSNAQPGGVVVVKVDPDDPEAVAIDWSAPLPPEAYQPAAPARVMDFGGGPPRPAMPQLAAGADEVEGMFGKKLACDGEHFGVLTPGATALRIFARMLQATCPARRIISISRRVLRTIGIRGCQLAVASCQ